MSGVNMEIDEQLENNIIELNNKRKAKQITKEETKQLKKLLQKKKALNREVREPETPEEKKERKKRKLDYERIATQYYSLKDKKRRMKRKLQTVKDDIALLRTDFPTFIGRIENDIQYKSNKRNLDYGLKDLRNKVEKLEKVETLNEQGNNELKNLRKKIKSMTKEEENLETFRLFESELGEGSEDKKGKKKVDI